MRKNTKDLMKELNRVTSSVLSEDKINAFHTTQNKFKKFDASFIGLGAGSSFGKGFYFSDEPIEEYGNKMNEYEKASHKK